MPDTNLRLAEISNFRQPQILAVLAVSLLLIGCGQAPLPPLDSCDLAPSSCQPAYVGSATCLACHPSFMVWHNLHGHSQALKVVEGKAPQYPNSASAAGFSDSPPGMGWMDIRWVIGGYTKTANFIGNSGHLFTDGLDGPLIQYNLPYLISLAPGGYMPTNELPAETESYRYDCFRCHTTGPQSLMDNGGQRQENRPGIEGTWVLDGVQCEACHGPGSAHIQNPLAGNIAVYNSAAFCGNCHGDPADSRRLPTADGFLLGNYQWAEVLASPHADFACSVCHEPHTSVIYDRNNAVRNPCRNCHTTANMARHQGKVLAQGDYAEFLSCESCHMSPAARNASSSLLGQARIGDTRTHLTYIDTLPRDFPSVLASNGRQLPTDTDGKAAVTVDVVCLRCHNGGGSAFTLSLNAASAIAEGIHNPP